MPPSRPTEICDMAALVVPKDGFPLRRKTLCCGKAARRGESVLVIPVRIQGTLKTHIVLHRRCIAVQIDKMPLDDEEYDVRFNRLRDAIEKTGDPFVKIDRKGKIRR